MAATLLAATPWYVEAFGPLYQELYAHRDGQEARRDVQGLAGLLALKPGQRVLDLGCGAGRHLVPLRTRGLIALGLDLSPALLAAADGQPVLRADMRRIPLIAGSCDAVLSLFTSFGYFDDAGNAAVLAEAARVLKSGGRIILDLFRTEFLRARLVGDERREFRSSHLSAARWLVQQRSWRASRLEKTVIILDAQERELARHRETVRAYEAGELETLLAAAGFGRPRPYADLAGAPDVPEAPRRITVAERTA